MPKKGSTGSQLARGVLIILISNVVNMFFGIITNLILPKHLSVESYAGIKTYQLYLAYVGILHFGFVDGIYLKYGGKEIKDLSIDSMKTSISSFRLFQCAVLVIGAILAFLIHDYILLIVALMVLPTNMLNFYKYLFQACGEYSAYGRVINVVSFATFVINISFVFFVKTDNYYLYLIGYLVLNFCIWLVIEVQFMRKHHMSNALLTFSKSDLIENMKNGILLTLGNFTSTITTTMDRWFVKLLIGTTSFAQYGFAVSMENFLNTAVTPVSITLYNALCKDNTKENVKKYRGYVTLFASLIVASAFPIKLITEYYLTKYYDSIKIVVLLFGSQMFYVVVKSVYVNLYKARKQQKRYFIKLLISLACGLLFNVFAYFICNIKEAYAFATLLSAIAWYILVQFDFKEEHVLPNEVIFSSITLCGFITSGFIFPSWLGLIVYILVYLISAVLFMRSSLNASIQLVTSFIKRKLNW